MAKDSKQEKSTNSGKYDFEAMEAKWGEKWFNSDIYHASDDSDKENKFILVEYPYPSGSGLHVGHAFSFTAGDLFARYNRMKGYNVMFPMGFDAFGLPTENYAIKMKRKPQEVTKENTDMYHRQMNELGLSFDWDREVNTTDPEYYKWTQWIFVKLFEKGLAYKEERPINWCPSCKIGLANEEVINGNCERCGAETSKRNISQWMVKITDYADRLIDGLKDTNFIEKVKAAQINWIDRKEWIDITYEIEDADKKSIGKDVIVSTTRPDTNFGATFVVLAPEHELVDSLIDGRVKTSEDVESIREYVKTAKRKSDLERQMEVIGRDKTGVFTGLYAVNKLTDKRMPIWITDFVLGTVGTGAVVGVPGHDIRDFEFAKQFNLPIIRVVIGNDGEKGEITKKEQVQEDTGIMMNSDFLDGMDIHEATAKIMDYLEEKGWGKRTMRYHLRDWIFSRQHYWGEPIPMVHCDKCGWQTVPEDQLPIVLPEVENYEPTDTGESPLANMTDWVETECPKCGGKAERETDTMPNWAGSDWYYMRYCDPHNDKVIADMDKMKNWLPVDVYIGGDEHNTLHLLYSRFIYQFLYDLGAVPTAEPYDERVSHGVILGPDNHRMSKSKGNVIIPGDVMGDVGADALRCYLMFIGPFDGTMAWNSKALGGVKRFLDRFYTFYKRNMGKWGTEDSKEVAKIVNYTVKFAQESIERYQFNTVMAKYMEMLNTLDKVDSNEISEESARKFLIILAPFAPFLTEELWQELNGYDVNAWNTENSVHAQSWPEYDESKMVDEIMEVPVQVNGKMRGKVVVSNGAGEEEVKSAIEADERLSKYTQSGIKKFIYIPGKIANVIV